MQQIGSTVSTRNGGKGLWSLPFIMVICTATITSTCFFMVTPTIAKYATILGAGLTIAGLVSGIFSVTALIARPFSGILADRLNKRVILTVSIVVMAVAAFGYSFSGNIAMLLFFRVLHGLGFAAATTVYISIVGTTVPRERLGEGIGYYGVCQILATAIGPSIGMAVGNHFGYRSTFRLTGVAFLLAAGVSLLIPASGRNDGSTEKEQKRFRISIQDLIAPEIIPYALFGALFSASNGIISAYLAILADDRGITGAGLYYTINAVVLLFSRPIAGRLTDKRGIAATVIPAYLLTAAALFGIGRAAALPMILAAGVLMALGQGSGSPGLQAASLKKLPPERAGVASGTFFIGSDIGQGIGPIIAGAIAERGGYGVMYSVFAGALLLGAAIFFLYSRKLARTGSAAFSIPA